MTIINLLTKYGEAVSVPAEHYILYWMFDASDENGNTWPVRKEDCVKILGFENI